MTLRFSAAEPAGRPPAYRPGGRRDRILRALQAGPMATGEIRRAVRDPSRGSKDDKASIWKALKAMRAEGTILPCHGRWMISDKGWAALGLDAPEDLAA